MRPADDGGAGRLPANPGMAQARERLADVARRRSSGWATLALLFSEPGPALVDALRSRALFRDLTDAVGWLDAGRERFLQAAATLDAFAQRIDEDTALDRLRSDHERLRALGDPAALVAELETLATRCGEESSAWTRGDDDLAKALRRDEHRRVEELAAGGGPELCERILAADVGEPSRSAAALLLELMRVESGRDYPAVLRGVFADGAG